MGVKISELPDSGAIADADLLELVQAGASRKGTFTKVKDWLTLSFARLSGADFTGPITVPAGASGNEVPRASEVALLAGAAFTGPIEVPAGATGAQVPQAQEVGDLAIAQRSDIYLMSNIVGTVSQSGGVPTGAIIERGSNANGEYVRFADGTQICTHSVTETRAISTPFAGGFRDTSTIATTLPATFVNTAYSLAFGVNMGSNAFSYVENTVNRTSSTFEAVPISVNSQSSTARNYSYIAIGRWF